MKHILAGALALSVLGGGVASAQDQDDYQSNPYYQDRGYGYDGGQGEYRDHRYLGPPERQYEGRDPYDRGDRWGGGYRYRRPYRYHYHHGRYVCRWRYEGRVCRYVR